MFKETAMLCTFQVAQNVQGRHETLVIKDAITQRNETQAGEVTLENQEVTSSQMETADERKHDKYIIWLFICLRYDFSPLSSTKSYTLDLLLS